MVGVRFGRLLVTSVATERRHRCLQWNCVCDCGGTKLANGATLRKGELVSCGCLSREITSARSKTHGMTRTRTHGCWIEMRRRCRDHNRHEAPNYVGRGISVCEAWLNSFECFLADVGPCPSIKHSLDRYPNNNGNYEPGNVRWATSIEQGNNTRCNRLIEYDGRTQTVTQWARERQIPMSTVSKRLQYGWSDSDAISKPVRPKRRASVQSI
jgi:hypothetical protein